MTQFTSKAIEESFIRLLNERPLDKITIKDIVDDCGISRNTFYYHFQDITALLEHILNADVERVLSQHLDMDSWEDGFISAARFALENKRLVYHIYNSVSRERVERYLYSIAGEVMRADVNLSVREVGAEKFGTRTEMKNLNSFKAIARAIQGERERQIDLLEAGKEVIQETRRWDDNKEYSYAMRSKEDAQDYRYFPDPDLVPVYISDEWLDGIRSRQPEFRTEKMKRYKEEYDIPEYDIDIITGSKHLADIFEASVALGSQPKKVSNWLMVETMRLLKEKEMEPEDIRFSPEHLSRLIALVDGKVINSSVAKEVFQVMFEEDVDPEQYVEEKGLKTVNDEGALRKVVEEVIAANSQSVEDYHNGKEKAIGFLVGQTMKAMKGKADPASVNQMLKELL